MANDLQWDDATSNITGCHSPMPLTYPTILLTNHLGTGGQASACAEASKSWSTSCKAMSQRKAAAAEWMAAFQSGRCFFFEFLLRCFLQVVSLKKSTKTRDNQNSRQGLVGEGTQAAKELLAKGFSSISVIPFSSAKATCHCPFWQALMAALKPQELTVSNFGLELLWLFQDPTKWPRNWFGHNAALCSTSAGLASTHLRQRKHWWGHCSKWYHSPPGCGHVQSAHISRGHDRLPQGHL